MKPRKKNVTKHDPPQFSYNVSRTNFGDTYREILYYIYQELRAVIGRTLRLRF